MKAYLSSNFQLSKVNLRNARCKSQKVKGDLNNNNMTPTPLLREKMVLSFGHLFVG